MPINLCIEYSNTTLVKVKLKDNRINFKVQVAFKYNTC